MNVIGVAQNFKQSRPSVIKYSLLIFMHFPKDNILGFMLNNVLLCVKYLLTSLHNYVIHQKFNRKLIAQTFAVRVSSAFLDSYSTTCIRCPSSSAGNRNLYSNIYILAKQPTLLCRNIVHRMVLLHLVNCL